MVEAADLFNASQYRRTVGGIAQSPRHAARLGGRRSRASTPEVVVTVAWDISWYQYRVSPESDNPVRLEGRGHDPAELEALVHRAGTPTWTTTAGSSPTSPGSSASAPSAAVLD